MTSTRDHLVRLLRSVRRAVLRRRRLLAAALTAVAVATGLHATAAPPPPALSVRVAARDLPAGSVLAADDLAEADLSPDAAPAGLVDHPEGRVLAAPLRAGEPVTDVRLVGPALAAAHPGRVAMPVRLPDAGMAGLLRPGDRVDLVAADPQGSGARVVAADVPVLAVPVATTEPSAAGEVGGRLVVVGAEPGDVPAVADAAVRYFLTFTYAR
ncbi:RcpC/CpaB family pilus assembly protein [Nocardioides sp. MAHUQ-72]|uniref:RcpC/CpaB family pilus assembly protein n=1 Tax=unclassified Nocardioides TaxID=2615069 RepID=UPI003608E3CC